MGGKTKKVIQNYQIVEVLEEYENEYEILLAKHLTDKQFYVLKKLSIKDGNNKALYDGLLNEASLLKLFNNENIVKCYRMLKTSNNIYLVYTYMEGVTLEELMQNGPKALTFSQKEGLAKQLCLIISQLQKNGIAHLNIHPQNIVVSKNFTIMLKQFIYAMEIPEEGQVEIKRKIPKSQFVAPEVRRGIASYEADIYSFGKILQKLDFKKCKKQNQAYDTEKKLAMFSNLIELMLEKDRQERININEVYQTFFSKVKRVKRLKSMSETNLYASTMSSTKSMSMSKAEKGIGKKAYGETILKILRHRTMSWFLIKLVGRITNIKLNSQYTVILSFLFLKKSTKLLASLAKYLHYGKNDIGIDITTKEQVKFFKTTDFYKLSELINRELQQQRKQFDSAVQAIYMSHSALIRKVEFNKEIKEEQIDVKYMNTCINEYVHEIFKKQYLLVEMNPDLLGDLVLMSYISHFESVQNMFKLRFLIEPVHFQEQIFVRKIRQMTREQLIEQMKINLQQKTVKQI